MLPRHLNLLLLSRRREAGLSVEEVARRIGVAPATLRRWERCIGAPGLHHAFALRDMLGITDAMLAAARPAEATLSGLRIVGYDDLQALGQSLDAMIAQIIALDLRNIGGDPADDEGDLAQWRPIYAKSRRSWRALVDDGRVVGTWHLLSLKPAPHAEARSGRLRDGHIRAEDIEALDAPGIYPLYLLSMALDPPYRGSRGFPMLYASLLEQVTEFAREGITFGEVCCAAFTADAQMLLRHLAFEKVAEHAAREATPVYAAPARRIVQRPELAAFPDLAAFYAT